MRITLKCGNCCLCLWKDSASKIKRSFRQLNHSLVHMAEVEHLHWTAKKRWPPFSPLFLSPGTINHHMSSAFSHGVTHVQLPPRSTSNCWEVIPKVYVERPLSICLDLMRECPVVWKLKGTIRPPQSSSPVSTCKYGVSPREWRPFGGCILWFSPFFFGRRDG